MHPSGTNYMSRCVDIERARLGRRNMLAGVPLKEVILLLASPIMIRRTVTSTEVVRNMSYYIS